MAELQIKTEYLPERCEICHQADFFDAKSNYCSRCGDVTDLLKNDNQETSSHVAQEIAGDRYRLARQFPRLLAGLWFSGASLIPVISIMLFFFKNMWERSDLLYFVILPVSTAALWGSTVGWKVLDRNLINSSGKAAGHGLLVSLLSFILYTFLLSLIGAVGSQDPFSLFNIFNMFMALMFFGLIIIGWLIFTVGASAGWLLHRLFSPSPKLPE